MAKNSKDLSKRVAEQDVMLKSQQKTLNELLDLLTQLVAGKAKSQKTDSPPRQESSPKKSFFIPTLHKQKEVKCG